MTLKEFVSMVEEIATSVKGEDSATESAAQSLTYRDRGGIQCSVSLHADGSLSADQTGVNVQFTVTGKG